MFRQLVLSHRNYCYCRRVAGGAKRANQWTLRGCIILFLVVGPLSTCYGVTPPPPKPLHERIKLASHIFIGVAEDARVIDNAGRVITPEPQALEIGQMLELSVHVGEALYPAAWQPQDTITVRYGGGLFSVSDLRQKLIGRELIYVVTQEDSYFIPSYPWQLTEPLEQRSDIQRIIEQLQEK